MRAEQRLGRTRDGRLVLDTHPDAATLAYAVGEELAPADAEALQAPGGDPEPEVPAGDPEPEVPAGEPEPEAKQAPARRNKARRPAADKGAQ